ncbi:thiol reductant ABC exporter subunit CydD [Adlercreutzia murintestinalis]|uniref:thiol reductant ABC exporter subunit CydD n=1 Tax=Adlercreutzia murintestinalis TaxID=2941325 RepID=UPI0020416203|nr:thiol reductant ABC exporter subunit CydD [Adlercreutzia murintestinalis]
MLALACAFAMALGALCAGQAIGLAQALVGLWSGASMHEQLGWIALFAGCFIGRSIVGNGEEALMDGFARRSADRLRRTFLEALWQGGPALVRAHGSAASTADALEGVDAIETLVRILIPKMANVMVVPAVLLVCLFWLDWVSGLIALACYPFTVLLMRLIGQSAGSEAQRRYAQFEQLSSSFVDISSGVGTLRAFGVERAFAERIFTVSERFRALTMKTLRIAMLSTTVLDLFATLCLAGVAIMLGFRLVEGTMAFFPALASLMLVPEFFKPIREYGEDYHATLEGKAALASIEELIHRSAHPDDVERTPEFSCRLDRVTAKIEVLLAKPGIIGIVGPSGSGKTTLLARIAGFAPSGGMRNTARARHVAYIPQTPYLFRASLRDNVAFYRPDADDAEVRDAIARVGLSDVVAQLPYGLDTIIGDAGRPLSGGQAHRVAVARALLDPTRDLWLLDEPTAHLDACTAQELIEHIAPLMEGKTVLVAMHDDAWLPHVSEVIEL